MTNVHPDDVAGLCVRHLANGGRRVQATTTFNGAELCAPCAVTEARAERGEGADLTLAGRRFHKHARNCTWCRKVLEAEPGTDAASPLKLCPDGKRLWVAAVEAFQKEGKPS